MFYRSFQSAVGRVCIYTTLGLVLIAIAREAYLWSPVVIDAVTQAMGG